MLTVLVFIAHFVCACGLLLRMDEGTTSTEEMEKSGSGSKSNPGTDLTFKSNVNPFGSAKAFDEEMKRMERDRKLEDMPPGTSYSGDEEYPFVFDASFQGDDGVGWFRFDWSSNPFFPFENRNGRRFTENNGVIHYKPDPRVADEEFLAIMGGEFAQTWLEPAQINAHLALEPSASADIPPMNSSSEEEKAEEKKNDRQPFGSAKAHQEEIKRIERDRKLEDMPPGTSHSGDKKYPFFF